MRMRISFLPNSPLKRFAKMLPMVHRRKETSSSPADTAYRGIRRRRRDGRVSQGRRRRQSPRPRRAGGEMNHGSGAGTGRRAARGPAFALCGFQSAATHDGAQAVQLAHEGTAMWRRARAGQGRAHRQSKHRGTVGRSRALFGTAPQRRRRARVREDEMPARVHVPGQPCGAGPVLRPRRRPRTSTVRRVRRNRPSCCAACECVCVRVSE